MKPFLNLRRELLALALLLNLVSTCAHEHVAAGAASTVPGTPLIFASQDDFGADTGYVFPLTLATNGPYAGFHHGELTVVALAATPDLGGPSPEAAALGSHIEAVLESVGGPLGGSFGFWESPGDELDAEVITFSVPVGETNGTHRFPVSENDGTPGADPYGHIHGRVYSATVPGLYRVGFRFVDTSHNGPGGGPVHAPSEPFQLYFQAGLTIAEVAVETTGTKLTFATQTGRNYFIEMAANPSSPIGWQSVAGPLPGNDHLQTVSDLPATAGTAWYRLRTE